MLNQAVSIIVILILFYAIRHILKKTYFTNIYLTSVLLWCGILFFVFSIVFNAKESFDAALAGIKLFINVVLPSLFPFFVTTELLTNLGFVNAVSIILEPIMRPIFNLPGSGSFPFTMGIISGYPVGAKATVNMKQNNMCTKIEAERLLAFCNNSGPLFIIGAVAVGMFHKPSLGLLLYTAHILSSLTVGLCFRYYKPISKHTINASSPKHHKNIISRVFNEIKKIKEKESRNFGEMLGEAIRNAIQTLLLIGGFIIFFSVLIQILIQLNIITVFSQLLSIFFVPLGISKELLPAVVSGFFEITTGIKMTSLLTSVSLIQQLMATSFILGWAGLSVHFQVISIVSKSNLCITPYLFGKGLHGIFAAFYTFILYNYTPMIEQASVRFDKPLKGLILLNFTNSLYLSFMYLGYMLLIITGLCTISLMINFCKKRIK